MIIDKLENLNRYTGISDNLRNAINFLNHTDLRSLRPGSFCVDGENLKYTVVDHKLQGTSDFWESHIKYIDIHAIVDGSETIRYIPNDMKSYIFKKDTDSHIYYTELGGSKIDVDAGNVVILFPGEIHHTNEQNSESGYVKKIILKVLCDI